MLNIIITLSLVIIGVVVTFTICNRRVYNMFVEGYIMGLNAHNNEGQLSLKEVFNHLFDSSIDNFIDVTGGLIYEISSDNQLEMVVIDSIDQLERLFDYKVIEIFKDSDYSRLIIKENV